MRLARRHHRRAAGMAAVTRLGAEIAAAHSTPRALRAATRLAPRHGPAPEEPAARVARAPVPAPEPVAAPLPEIAGMEDWQKEWIFGGDTSGAMSSEDAAAHTAL